jgi:hypothetical protein
MPSPTTDPDKRMTPQQAAECSANVFAPERRIAELERELCRVRTLAHAARVDLQRLRPNSPSATFSTVDSVLKTIAQD